jgi:hypothetical protein
MPRLKKGWGLFIIDSRRIFRYNSFQEGFLMDATQTISQATLLQFRAHVENGVIVPDEVVVIPSDQTYLVTMEPDANASQSVDALAEIAAMAQPLGPADLARNFDLYTGRTVTHETAN